MAATLKSLAQELNLSHTTVAKILNDDPHFRTTDDTRQRVRALANREGYRPSMGARYLRRRETRHIGLLLHDIHDPYMAALAHGVEKAVAAAGYSLVLGLSAAEENNAGGSKPLDPTHWYIDGLIAGLFGYYPRGVFAEWNRKMPVAAIGNVRFGTFVLSEIIESGVPHVDFDQFEGARCVGHHLVAQGCRRVAYLGWPDLRRTDGISAGVSEAGGNVVETLAIGTQHRLNPMTETALAAVRDAVSVRLAAPEPFPDGLFCYNDQVAGVAFGALRRHGVRVPADVCLVGFNDDPDSPFREVPLSSVSVPTDEMCRLAVESILDRLRGAEGVPAQDTLPPRLVARESSLRLPL